MVVEEEEEVVVEVEVEEVEVEVEVEVEEGGVHGCGRRSADAGDVVFSGFCCGWLAALCSSVRSTSNVFKVGMEGV